MSITTTLAKLEHRAGIGVGQKEQAARRSREFMSRFCRDWVQFMPEMRLVTREDCSDEEEWNDVRSALALADGEFEEAARLEALPAPRREAHQAWVNEAPTEDERILRLVITPLPARPEPTAITKARERAGLPKIGYR